ncbi:hypothetical protein [Acinetobacter pittii]|uniref:hypothetical protein n=1 Tax=Acinetobacter pittii TaxID=48296 RepID=UPI00388E7C83
MNNYFNVLIITDLKLGRMKTPSQCACAVGHIDIKKPSFEYNTGLAALSTTMYDCKDYNVYTLSSKESFGKFISTLKTLADLIGIPCPFLNAIQETYEFYGDFIFECLTWFNEHVDILFRPDHLAEFTQTVEESQNFQLVYFKVLETFRKAGLNGFIQFNTLKTIN